MTIGKVHDAERFALTEFDKWNDVTGFVATGTSYYYELQSVIEDAVHIGIQMALYGKVIRNEDGTVNKRSSEKVKKPDATKEEP